MSILNKIDMYHFITLSEDDVKTYVLYDAVHLIKNIQKNLQ